jgi:CheY-like chemotaxis protein
MSDTATESNRRILIVDDNPAIHEDIRKILGATSGDKAALKAAEAELFAGRTRAQPAGPQFQIDSAYRGETALELVRKSLTDDQPYAMAFVDMRMPPGWDGLETITRLWEVCPDLQIVICTAYSDHSWTDIVQRLRPEDDLMVLRKPFDVIEIRQFAHTLCAKWDKRRRTTDQIREVEAGLMESQHKELMREIATDAATEKAAAPMEETREDLQNAQEMIDRLYALVDMQHRALVAMADRNSDNVSPELASELAAVRETRVQLRTVLGRIFRNTLAVKAVVRSVREIAHHKPAEPPAEATAGEGSVP